MVFLVGKEALERINGLRMKKVSREEIQYLGRLARLQITENDLADLSEKLSTILDYMSKLSDLEFPEELSQEHFSHASNIFRSDSSKLRFNSEDALRRSPDPDKEYFRVPKVIS